MCAYGCRAPAIVFVDGRAIDDAGDVSSDGRVIDDAVVADAGDAMDALAGDVVDGSASDASDAAVDARVVDGATIASEVLVSPSCRDMTTPGCRRVFVTGGSFSMGTSVAMDSTPVQTGISVGNFYLDSTEVTVARLRAFRDALLMEPGGTREFRVTYPNGSEVIIPSGRVRASALQATALTTNSVGSVGLDSHPANAVSWYTAMAFCIWDGGRLPTEAEFEFVSRWWLTSLPAGRTFAWGNADPMGRCDLAHWMLQFYTPGGMCPSDNMRATVVVGSKQRGRVGADEGHNVPIFELSGNIAEWLADTYLPYVAMGTADPCWGRSQHNPFCNEALPEAKVFRGGSALASASLPYLIMDATRRNNPPTEQEPMIGFRCARDR